MIAGANMVLVDFHPTPDEALCDGPQALRLKSCRTSSADVALARQAYERRRDLALKYAG